MNPINEDSIEEVIELANSLPDFPNKQTVINRLETGNLNRYQEAQLLLNELLANTEAPSAAPGEPAISMDQIQALHDRISNLGAAEIETE